MEPFAVDGRLNAEQLHALLSAQAEYPALDYKSECDLRNRRGLGRAEFVKDCAAMMSRPFGGYLVIGVDGYGRPVGATLDEKQFDSANLKGMLAKYLEGEIPVVSQLHRLKDGDVVVVYIGRRSDHLFPIVKSDVTYVDEQGAEKVHLRAGDVIVRDGTSSRRWRTADLANLMKPLVDSIRREEQERFAILLEQLTRQQRGQSLAQGAIGTVTWRLPLADFRSAISELSRAEDTKALRVLHLEMQGEGLRLAQEATKGGVDSTAFAELLDFLDHAITVAATGVILDDPEMTKRAVELVHRIYVNRGLDGQPFDDMAPRIWLEIAARVLGLLALRVRLEEWENFDRDVLRPVGQSYVFRSWLRHADVWATRTGQSEKMTDDGIKIRGLLISVARQQISRIPALRPDVAVDSPIKLGVVPERGDLILDSVCQADFLWCLIAASGGRGIGEQYPGFSALYDYRTRPMMERVLTDRSLAEILLPNVEEAQVMQIVDGILELASQQGFW